MYICVSDELVLMMIDSDIGISIIGIRLIKQLGFDADRSLRMITKGFSVVD
jgi:hypothetical protein